VSSNPPAPFGELLDRLCREQGAGHGPVANTELAKRVNELGGDITHAYIAQLRNGGRDNPTLQTVSDLAAALQVSPAVFAGGPSTPLIEDRLQLRRGFSAKLNHLFAHVHPPDRGPFAPEDIARAINADRKYGSISATHIRDLLQPPDGTLPNPRWRHLLGLAWHLGLADHRTGPRISYFLNDAEADAINAEIADFKTLRDAGVLSLVMRVAQHSPEWTPKVRQAAVRAISEAFQSKEPTWFFPATNTEGQPQRSTDTP